MSGHVFNNTKNVNMPVNYVDSIMFRLRINEKIFQVGAIQNENTKNIYFIFNIYLVLEINN